MSYLVYARKFRPQTFEEVLGQEPIVTTLKNAVRQGRIPQSFLFSGPRGVGKTSTARILAKALNCAKGPTEEPCGKCVPCTEITQGNSLDVLEIDGASNRGIDEIRNLRETVKYKPVTGRVKVYIIDEVHMLTLEAFNALLKTLEEPPSHVKFIFATTEPHKVPLTILSRCQRFHFKRIPTAQIAAKLEEITKKEKLKAEKEALFLIAKASDGALRDGESLLDQLASFAEEKIRKDDVLSLLGLASEETYCEVLSELQAKDAGKIFKTVEELYSGGKDLVQFAKGLLEIFRHLLLFQCAENAGDFIDLSEDAIRELGKRKEVFSRGELLLAISLLENLQGDLRRNLAPPKLLLETALLKLLHLDGLKIVEEVLADSSKFVNPAKAGIQSSGSPIKTFWNDTSSQIAPQGLSRSLKEISMKGIASAAPQPRNDNAVPPGAAKSAVIASPEGPPEHLADPPIGVAEAKQSPSLVSRPISSSSPVLAELVSLWPRVLEYVKAKRMSTGIFLSESEPVEVNENTVVLGLPSEFQFHKETLEKDSNRKLVEEAFQTVAGQKLRAQFVITKRENETQASTTPPLQEETSKLPEIITKALDIFEGARIIRRE